MPNLTQFIPRLKSWVFLRHYDKEYEAFDVGFGWHQQQFHYFKCDLKPEDCDEELREHSRIGWQRNCSDWEMIDDYTGSSSYAKHISFMAYEAENEPNPLSFTF